jgi:hypothetical protein
MGCPLYLGMAKPGLQRWYILKEAAVPGSDKTVQMDCVRRILWGRGGEKSKKQRTRKAPLE